MPSGKHKLRRGVCVRVCVVCNVCVRECVVCNAQALKGIRPRGRHPPPVYHLAADEHFLCGLFPQQFMASWKLIILPLAHFTFLQWDELSEPTKIFSTIVWVSACLSQLCRSLNCLPGPGAPSWWDTWPHSTAGSRYSGSRKLAGHNLASCCFSEGTAELDKGPVPKEQTFNYVARCLLSTRYLVS